MRSPTSLPFTAVAMVFLKKLGVSSSFTCKRIGCFQFWLGRTAFADTGTFSDNLLTELSAMESLGRHGEDMAVVCSYAVMALAYVNNYALWL